MRKLIYSINPDYNKSDYIKNVINDNRFSAVGPFHLSEDRSLTQKNTLSLNMNFDRQIGSADDAKTLKSLIDFIYRAKLERFFLQSPNKIYFPGQVFYVTDLEFLVYAVYPPTKPGYISKDTEIYISLDPLGEYDAVTISAIKDTLPKSYDFDLYNEYLYPALKNRIREAFRLGDSFNHLGIDFKITVTQPSVTPYGCMRIGFNTEVVVGKPIEPKLVDLIPTDLCKQIRLLCPRQQQIALRLAALQLDDLSIQRIISCYSEQFKTSDELIKTLSERVKIYKSVETDCDSDTEYTHYASTDAGDYRNICTVCCQKFNDTDRCITFDCGHLFHWTCVRFWIGENQTCPNCRAHIGDTQE